MADRIGVINKGELILIEQKKDLMKKLGKKQLTFDLHHPLQAIPPSLANYNLELSSNGETLVYTYDGTIEDNGIAGIITKLTESDVKFKDLYTHQSSLEDIFVGLLQKS